MAVVNKSSKIFIVDLYNGAPPTIIWPNQEVHLRYALLRDAFQGGVLFYRESGKTRMEKLLEFRHRGDFSWSLDITIRSYCPTWFKYDGDLHGKRVTLYGTMGPVHNMNSLLRKYAVDYMNIYSKYQDVDKNSNEQSTSEIQEVEAVGVKRTSSLQKDITSEMGKKSKIEKNKNANSADDFVFKVPKVPKKYRKAKK